MCAIIGALLWDARLPKLRAANTLLNSICEASLERGRDGRGFYISQLASFGRIGPDLITSTARDLEWGEPLNFFVNAQEMIAATVIGNLRAEPTTEYVEEKLPSDQQPYKLGPWTIVHNGTIANDKELRTHELHTSIDSAAIVELLAGDHMLNQPVEQIERYFMEQVGKLKGSYAILAVHDEHPSLILAACNYRPIWYVRTDEGFFLASARHYLPKGVPQMLEPYTAAAFRPEKVRPLGRVGADVVGKRALVVCSGGLDSVVAARSAQAAGFEIELLHFQYGSRAEGPEVQAVADVAAALDVPYRLFPLPIYRPEDSPLLRADSTIAGGEAGAEFAHEWVPARNLAMLAVATALAEAGGFDTIVLGNNLEEAGAYPDNEPEFIDRFNDLLPFAVADGKRVRVVMPVGNMMKHEIVALGHELGAPLDKTWSCYRAGEQHCGTCGPCFMRRTAFAINHLPEVITYANEEK